MSHAAPATWFPSKQALFGAIAAEGFRELADALRDARRNAMRGSDDAVEALRRAGIAYVTFALDHTAHFLVMFQPDLRGGGHVPDGRAAFVELLKIVGNVLDTADPDDPIVWRRAEASWAFVHGIATLLTANALTVREGQTAHDLAVELVTAAVPGLATRPG